MLRNTAYFGISNIIVWYFLIPRLSSRRARDQMIVNGDYGLYVTSNRQNDERHHISDIICVRACSMTLT